MKPLSNIKDICLNEPTLIEASAGTGKTYTLAELFIRALREIEGAHVESVLVVTFTNAAAAELRGRLYARLLEERGKAGKDDVKERQIWDDALLMFDKAGITTIHGFCERMLSEFAFEGGLPFNAELDENGGKVVDELVFDYWRRKFYSNGLDPEVIRNEGLFAPEDIASFTKMSLAKPLAVTEPADGGVDRRCVEAIEKLQAVLPPTSAALGIQARFQNQVDAFNGLRGLFDDAGAWSAMSWERRAEKILSASSALASSKSAKLAEIVALIQAIRTCHKPLKIRMMIEARNQLAQMNEQGLTPVGREQRKAGMRTFDDILNDVRVMLEKNETAVAAMRNRYRIAMIDEFQDTDPVQWRIFKTVFMDGPVPHRLILVGDPKQAIYSFRGGDIDTYCRVCEEILARGGSVWTLTTNYRSEPSAVDAVNRVFLPKEASAADATFKVRNDGVGIEYNRIQDKTANEATHAISILQRADAVALADPSVKESVGLVVRNFDKPQEAADAGADTGGGEGGPGVNDPVGADVVREIRRLMDPGSWKIFRYVKEGGVWRRGEGRAVRPRDICILANSNETARRFHDKLCLNSIPCTIRSEKSVFAEEEADWMDCLLFVAVNSARRGLGRLLATPLFEHTPDAILSQVGGEAESEIAEAIRHGYGKWQKSGIEGFFASVAVAEACGIKSRILSGPLGERHWTNLSQIVEILGNAENAGHLSPEASHRWLQDTIRDSRSGDKNPEFEFRLDSDAESVTAMTIHKSKGLEFPIVFMVEIDNGGHRVGAVDSYHRDGQTILSCMLGDNAAQKQAEDLEESIRKLYVGMTRAVHRTYLYVRDKDYEQGKQGRKVVQYLSGVSEVFQKDATVSLTRGTVEVEMPQPSTGSDAPASVPLAKPPQLDPPCGVCPEAKPWTLTSFSGIKEALAKEDVAEMRDELSPASDEPRDTAMPDEAERASTHLPLRYTMRGGPVFGNAIHSVFETCPFDADAGTIRDHVVEALNGWYLKDMASDDAACDELAAMIHDTLNADLVDADGGTFKLCGVPSGRRLNELQFHFPLPEDKSIAEFLDVIRRWGGIYAMALEGLADSAKAIRGMLKGIIDLIFEHGGKYYIADWKTNILDGERSAFDIDPARPLESRIATEIAHSQYSLQWAIYAVALHRHLRNTLPGYDYATHFGGVRYCFVRGMSPAHPGAGVWVQTPPPPEAMAALDGFF